MVLLLGKDEVVEIIKPLDSIVPSEDVESILDHLPSVAEPRGRCLVKPLFQILVRGHHLSGLFAGVLLALNRCPKVFVHFKLIEV